MKEDLKTIKKAWSYKARMETVMREVGLEDELSSTKDVALCIIANPNIILEEIMRDGVFKNMSRSTIKRAVAYLCTNGYVEATQNPKDKRQNLLNFKWLRL